MKEVELKKFEILYRGMSRPTALSVNFGHPGFQLMDGKNTFEWNISSKSRKKRLRP